MQAADGPCSKPGAATAQMRGDEVNSQNISANGFSQVSFVRVLVHNVRFKLTQSGWMFKQCHITAASINADVCFPN